MDDNPLPRGAYNIDWDNMDEMSNPFQTSTKISTKVTVPSPSVITSPTARGDSEMPTEVPSNFEVKDDVVKNGTTIDSSTIVRSSTKQNDPVSSQPKTDTNSSAASTASGTSSKELTKEERTRLRQEQQAKMREMIKLRRQQQQQQQQADGVNDPPIVIAESKTVPIKEAPQIQEVAPSSQEITSKPPVESSVHSQNVDLNGVNQLPLSTEPICHVQQPEVVPVDKPVMAKPDEPVIRKAKNLREDVGNYRESINMTDSLELSREALLKSADPQALQAERQLQDKNEELVALKRNNEEMIFCLKHYQELLVEALQDTEYLKADHQESLKRIIAERDQTAEDLDTVHKAFNDLHRRHELAKEALQDYKQNEDKLKEAVQQHLNHQKLIEQKYQSFKAQAEKKMQAVKVEIDTSKRVLVAEIDRLKTALKRAEVHIKSLESQVDQKSKENEELTKICDELLGKHSYR